MVGGSNIIDVRHQCQRPCLMKSKAGQYYRQRTDHQCLCLCLLNVGPCVDSGEGFHSRCRPWACSRGTHGITCVDTRSPHRLHDTTKTENAFALWATSLWYSGLGLRFRKVLQPNLASRSNIKANLPTIFFIIEACALLLTEISSGQPQKLPIPVLAANFMG